MAQTHRIFNHQRRRHQNPTVLQLLSFPGCRVSSFLFNQVICREKDGIHYGESSPTKNQIGLKCKYELQDQPMRCGFPTSARAAESRIRHQVMPVPSVSALLPQSHICPDTRAARFPGSSRSLTDQPVVPGTNSRCAVSVVTLTIISCFQPVWNQKDVVTPPPALHRGATNANEIIPIPPGSGTIAPNGKPASAGGLPTGEFIPKFSARLLKSSRFTCPS